MHHDEYADLYLRLSLDRAGNTAIERQEKDCRGWAEQNGLKVRAVHVDRGRSGFKKGVERKGLDAALAAMTSGVVGTGLDSSQDDARRVIEMLSEFARAESANIGLRVRSALNAERIPSPRGGTWSVGSVAQILRGPATAGLLPETVKKADGSGYTSVVRPWRDPATGETVSVMAQGQKALISPADQARVLQVFAERSRQSALGRSQGAFKGESRHLLTGVLRCANCGSRMSKQGNSYRCQTARLGRTCDAPGGAYQEALDEAVTRVWVERLTTAEPGDPLLEAVADRWTAQLHPDAVAKRASVLAALDSERAALGALDAAHYVRHTLPLERYLPLAEVLSRRIVGLTHTLAANPVPEADISALLDPVLVRESWEAAGVKERRDFLRLALLEVRVSQGIRGQRFDPATRLAFVWATDPPTLTGGNGEPITRARLCSSPTQGQ